MPTYSSTANFDLQIDTLVEEAYERCGLQDRSGYHLKTAKRSLNLMIAEWANRGLNLWTITERSATVAADATQLSGTTLYPVNAAGNASTAGDEAEIIDITEAVIRDSSNNDYSMTRIGRSSYLDYTVKTSKGRPSQFYFERTILPKVFLFPAAQEAYTFKYYASIRMLDIDTYPTNAQIPFRFLPCLTAGLAYYLSLKYAPDRVQLLKTLYEEEFRRAADEDVEKASYSMVPRNQFMAGY
jgi:hypothetical protein|tara:strand:- start:22 stop:744 length:723 start_codon:yes stop_codon:yes gene_type:complete